MKTTYIQIRVSEQDKAEWTEAAEKQGMTLSEYIRRVMILSTHK